MQTISDEALDRFADGWTPDRVRELVASYRELKRAFDGFVDVHAEVSEQIAIMRRNNPQFVESKVGTKHDGPGFRAGAVWVRSLIAGVLWPESKRAK